MVSSTPRHGSLRAPAVLPTPAQWVISASAGGSPTHLEKLYDWFRVFENLVHFLYRFQDNFPDSFCVRSIDNSEVDIYPDGEIRLGIILDFRICQLPIGDIDHFIIVCFQLRASQSDIKDYP